MAESLDERLFAATVGTLELYGVYLGDRLGLYAALRDGPLTPPELAGRCGIHARYAREWLEQQAVAGVLTVEDAAAEADARRYALPDEHAAVLLDATDAAYVAPFGRMLVGIANVLDEVVEAYRSGGGVPYARYGADFRDGQGDINRPAFSTALVDEWVPGMSGAVESLRGGARAVDVGCGQGWAAIALARRFPEAEVWGIDSDAASIEDARANAEAAGASLRFECADAASLSVHGPFELVTILEVLHDLSRPVEVLAAARHALASGGAVLVADEAVAGAYTAPGDDLERMMYGWSITHCLPASMAEQPSEAIGTAIRESTVRDLAARAGFGHVDVLDVDGGFFRLYELRA